MSRLFAAENRLHEVSKTMKIKCTKGKHGQSKENSGLTVAAEGKAQKKVKRRCLTLTHVVSSDSDSDTIVLINSLQHLLELVKKAEV